MKWLNFCLLLFVMVCVVLVSVAGSDSSKARFVYAEVIIVEYEQKPSISWVTETDSYTFSSGDFVRNCQDMLIQLSGASEPIGRIRLVKNLPGMLNFLSEHGWELVSSNRIGGGIFVCQTICIFRMLVD